MTYRQFQLRLRKAIQRFNPKCGHLVNVNFVRYELDGKHFCPITLVCYADTGEFWSDSSVNFAARRIKLPYQLRNLIIHAADNVVGRSNKSQQAVARVRGYLLGTFPKLEA